MSMKVRDTVSTTIPAPATTRKPRSFPGSAPWTSSRNISVKMGSDGSGPFFENEKRGQTRQTPFCLKTEEWRRRQAAHEARVRSWTDPHQIRIARSQKHPVYDFLFSYYSYRPSW